MSAFENAMKFFHACETHDLRRIALRRSDEDCATAKRVWTPSGRQAQAVARRPRGALVGLLSLHFEGDRGLQL